MKNFGYYHFMAVVALVFGLGWCAEQYFTAQRGERELRRLELEKRPCTP